MTSSGAMSAAGALGGGDGLNGVHYRDDRNHGVGAGSQGLGHAVEHRLRSQGAGGVMDQNRFGAVLHGCQCGPHGIRPGGAAIDHCEERAAIHQLLPEVLAEPAELLIARR